MDQRASSQYIRDFRDPANDALIGEHGLTGLMLKAVKWDKPSSMEPEERDALLKDWQDRDAAFGMINWYRAAGLVVPAMDEVIDMPDFAVGDFPKLMIPTLVIWAMDDLALPSSNLEGIEELVPGVKIVQVADCGHFVPWEAPSAVNAAMAEFLDKA